MKLVDTAGLVSSSFRTLPRFRVVRAASLADAVGALAAADRPAVLAGGTDLPARFNEGFSPDVLVDVSRIDALWTIEISDGALAIGAAVTHAEGARHPLIVERLPSFGRAWSRIANVRVRMSATLGGNLMARRTRYEGAILLSALAARLRFETQHGQTDVAVEQIWSQAIPPRGLLTTILIPLRAGLVLDYERSLRPIMTQAVALDAIGAGRVVTATEHVVPRVQEVSGGAVAPSPAQIFGDPVTGDAYLQRVSAVFLQRQLQRTRAA